MRKILTTVSALAFSAGVAHAGGMVVPQEPVVAAPAPIMAQAYDWTGGYAGLGLTYGRGSYNVDDSGPFEEDAGDFWPSGSGWGIGGFVGHNWQNGNMVYGVEGHVSGHRMRGTTDLGSDGAAEVRTDVRSMASLRGRVGIAQDRTLFFVTAGPAIANVRHNADLPAGEGGAVSIGESRTVNGLVIGAGVEHALNNGWHIRGDIEHHRFRSRDFTTADDLVPAGPSFPGVSTRVNLARVSAVFRF